MIRSLGDLRARRKGGTGKTTNSWVFEAAFAAHRAEIDAIVDSTNEFLKDNYVDVQLDDPKDVTVDGQPGAQLAGIGKDKDGNEVKFLSAIIALGPTSIAEIWAAVFPEGSNDLDAATAVLDSFKVVKQ